MNNRLQQQCSAGFTLLEMLLALTLMSIILSLAYGGLKASTRAARSGELAIEQNQSMRMAHQFVRRQLNRMLPLAYINDDQGLIMFQGESDKLTFVGPMPGYLGFGGSQVQQIELARADDGYELLFRHAVLAGFDEYSLDDQEPIVLLDGIDDGQFEYIKYDEQGELTDWSGDWENPGELPEAVSLRLDLAESNRSSWPELLAVRRIADVSISAGAGLQQHIQQLINQRRNQSRNRRNDN